MRSANDHSLNGCRRCGHVEHGGTGTPGPTTHGGFEQAYQDAAERDRQLVVLRERRDWLNARIDAKKLVGWQTEWDERERDALDYAITQLEQEEAA